MWTQQLQGQCSTNQTNENKRELTSEDSDLPGYDAVLGGPDVSKER
jgi:hypothetical protein